MRAVTASLMSPTDRTYSHRLTLDITEADFQALAFAAVPDKLKITHLMRALIEQWSNDEDLRERTRLSAVDLRAAGRQRGRDMT